MLVEIKHTTNYTYDDYVTLSPHTLNLQLQNRTYFDVLDYKLNVDPKPVGISSLVNLENVFYSQIWFKEPSKYLNIEVHAIVDTAEFNPFGFIFDKEFIKKEKCFHYGKFATPLLKIYTSNENHKDIQSFALEFFYACNDVLSLIYNVNAYIYEHWTHIIREEVGFFNPMHTFLQKKGSCRDLALLLMEILNSVGLATRYVSGYAYNPELEDGHNLHAWVDVFIPGGGWVGVDPSLGLFTDYSYFPLSTSFNPQNTLPVIGNYGGAANSNLDTTLTINKMSGS